MYHKRHIVQTRQDEYVTLNNLQTHHNISTIQKAANNQLIETTVCFNNQSSFFSPIKRSKSMTFKHRLQRPVRINMLFTLTSLCFRPIRSDTEILNKKFWCETIAAGECLLRYLPKRHERAELSLIVPARANRVPLVIANNQTPFFFYKTCLLDLQGEHVKSACKSVNPLPKISRAKTGHLFVLRDVAYQAMQLAELNTVTT